MKWYGKWSASAAWLVIPSLFWLRAGLVLAQDAPDSPNVSALVQQWESMRQEPATIRFKARHLLLVLSPDPKAPSRSPDEFQRLFHERLVPLVGAPGAQESMEAEVDRFLDSNTGEHGLFSRWENVTVIVDGANSRSDVEYRNRKGELVQDSRVRSATDETEYDSHINQAMTRDGHSKIRMIRWKDVRHIPNISRFAGDSSLRVESHGLGRSKLTVGDVEIDFANDRQFVHHAGWKKDGVVIQELWQELPRVLPGGVDVPGISATVRYFVSPNEAPRIRLADVYVLDSVHLNEEVSPDTFLLAAPKGTIVVNTSDTHLQKEGALQVTPAPHDIADVKEFAAGMIETPTHIDEPAKTRSGLWMTLIIGNLIVVTAVAAFLSVRYLKLRRSAR